MSYRRVYPQFTVSVQAGLSEDGVWMIDARVQFLDGKTPPLGSRLLVYGLVVVVAAWLVGPFVWLFVTSISYQRNLLARPLAVRRLRTSPALSDLTVR